MRLKEIVHEKKSNIAFIVGNGINRFLSGESMNSWEALLLKLCKKDSMSEKTQIPKGIALTEFYDILELRNSRKNNLQNLQRQFCKYMGSWQPLDHHISFVNWAKHFESPILTTNFEDTLSVSGKCELYRIQGSKFTDFYPWESYYSCKKISSPDDGFAIWHINGMQKYHRSIRLGLSHYMGSVARARTWIHKSNDSGGLYSGGNEKHWRGSASWLHIFFNRPLVIFGLGLERDEVFLRWLLIERAKYFNKFPKRRKEAWYFHTEINPRPGKMMLLKSLGVKPMLVANYRELYVDPWVINPPFQSLK